jgi:hypothetical protein
LITLLLNRGTQRLKIVLSSRFCVDQEKAQSQRGQDIETEAAWQAHFIKLNKIFRIPDPCGPFQGYQWIVAIYVKYIQCGINYNNKQVLCLAIVRGYSKALNTLFRLQKFAPPADLTDPNNMAANLANNLLKVEDLARHHSPFENSIFAVLQQMSETSCDKDLVNNLLFDIVALGRYIGPCLSKYAQTSQDLILLVLPL